MISTFNVNTARNCADHPYICHRTDKMCIRDRPRPPAKVPKCVLSGKGCGISKTTRMLAQKQPHIQRVRNSSLVERSCAENVRG